MQRTMCGLSDTSIERATPNVEATKVRRRPNLIGKPRTGPIAMHNTEDLMSRLRTHVGRRLDFGGRPWRIVEVLAADGRLVLESQDAEPPIQPDQYGNPAMRGQEHVEVALLTASGEPSPDAARLLAALDMAAGQRATG
jgi:hypothetical protein